MGRQQLHDLQIAVAALNERSLTPTSVLALGGPKFYHELAMKYAFITFPFDHNSF